MSESPFDESAWTPKAKSDDYGATANDTGNWRDGPVVELVPLRRGSAFGPADFSLLRRHTINFNAGSFSSDGLLQTNSHDVEAIFGEFIPQWIAHRDSDEPPRIVLYAHGGLVSEQDAAIAARDYISFWVSNGIYPVFFIWETGFLESIQQLWSSRSRDIPGMQATRGLFDDARDATLEVLARSFGARQIWSGIKRSAEQTFQGQGDGLVVVESMKKLHKKHKDMQIHLAGHSAGSIFWSHGLPLIVAAAIPVKSLQLLAPAVTTSLFREKVLPLLENGGPVEQCSIYTMMKEYELDDTVGPYQKSLLYLVQHALEDIRDTPILGLEVSLRSDTKIAPIFGLGSHVAALRHEVIWSVTAQSTGISASRSTSHGGFDDDPATLESLVRRIKNLDDAHSVVRLQSRSIEQTSFGTSSGGSMGFFSHRDFSMGKQMYLGSASGGSSNRGGLGGLGGGRGNMRALCIGIDNYPTRDDRLNGCVNDAHAWGQVFATRGFSLEMLVDQQATRLGIMNAFQSIIAGSQSGDVIAIQISSHGTQLTDFSQDEDDDGMDEALVPFDHRTNGYVVDDDIAEIVDRTPQGVSLNFFMDLCHSGSGTRMLLGPSNRSSNGVKSRFLRPDLEMLETHARTANRSAKRALNAYANRPEVLFAACAPGQTSKERGGQGDFTRYALQVLAGNSDGLTNASFVDAVKSVGRFEDQDPALWCDSSMTSLKFLGGNDGPRFASNPKANAGRPSEVAVALGEMEKALGRLRSLT